jgi:hypothetical protein
MRAVKGETLWPEIAWVFTMVYSFDGDARQYGSDTERSIGQRSIGQRSIGQRSIGQRKMGTGQLSPRRLIGFPWVYDSLL